MSGPLPSSRLSKLQAARVVAQRDFLAILFSRAFLFFLLGPLFPVAVGSLAGNIGGAVEQTVNTNVVALAMAPQSARPLRPSSIILSPSSGAPSVHSNGSRRRRTC